MSGEQCSMVDWRLSGRQQDEKMLFFRKNRNLIQKIFSFSLFWPKTHVSINFKLLPSERSPYEKFISQKFSLCLVRLDFFSNFSKSTTKPKNDDFCCFLIKLAENLGRWLDIQVDPSLDFILM